MAEHNHNHSHDAPVNEGAESLVGALRFLFLGLRIIMLLLVVLLFRTGCFTVNPTQQTLTYRFGSLQHDDKGESIYASGQNKAYWVWPQPVGNTLTMPSKSTPLTVKTTRFWHRKNKSVVSRPGEASQDSQDPIMLGQDGYVLTGDSYMFHVSATMTYFISDAERFYLSFYKLDQAGNFDTKQSNKLANQVITSHLEQAIAMESTTWKVDDAFYDKIDTYRSQLLEKVRKDIKNLEYGITIDRIDIKPEDRKPLKQVQSTFNNVRKERADARRLIEISIRQANKIRLLASQQAGKLKTDAEVYQTELNNRLINLKKLDSKGDDNLMYIYLEALDNILLGVKHKFIIRKDTQGTDTYWLQLGPNKHQSGAADATK